jgi:CCR4-NOT transcription complex subunit 2
MLSTSLASPLVGDEQRKLPVYNLPECYQFQRTVFKPSHMSKFVVETLFYIFYNMPFDRWQSLAAQELIHKKWQFWEEKNIWIIEGASLDEETKRKFKSALPDWLAFDASKWEYSPIQDVDMGKLVTKITNETSDSVAEEDDQE